jgi:hypothetical protein
MRVSRGMGLVRWVGGNMNSTQGVRVPRICHAGVSERGADVISVASVGNWRVGGKRVEEGIVRERGVPSPRSLLSNCTASVARLAPQC